MKTSSPLYRNIASQMKEEIHKKAWKQGEAIPTEAKLSESFNASRVTVRQAIQLLVQEGLLYKIQGSGTYVKEAKIEHNIYSLRSFTEEMEAYGKTISNHVVDFQLLEPEESIRQILNLSDGEKTFYVRRQRMVDNIPFVLEDTYLPVRLFPDLSYEIMSGSKYDYIENKKKLKIKDSFQEVIPLLPEEKIQKLLHLSEAIPILKVQLFSNLTDDQVFEYSELYFKSDEYKFTIVANRNS
ncbi:MULTISPECIES: GntR family transcriptional regulator [Alteribacter]|uniref:UTRA domain-containing protein n=1 Tax=Alteribacter keqinensis TaxID=2483800 RepID=A0A3M7U065_9BACI|nr:MULTISPECIES: UTRA domain-containing protein [Alteribacter]MBM7097354.1 UTRA domain-containing protein [Alteribacter salitolerans]RNA70542.1 UTRA domain-containing protein [Alteribacter keqinensis]